MPFLTELHLSEMPDGATLRLLQDLIYQGARDSFRVKAGFLTDLASIPGFANWLIPKLGKHNKPAVIHDWLYTEQPFVIDPPPRVVGEMQITSNGDWTRPITRKEADGIFRRIMREMGVGWTRRWLMYYAVRLGGWIYWNRNAKKLGR